MFWHVHTIQQSGKKMPASIKPYQKIAFQALIATLSALIAHPRASLPTTEEAELLAYARRHSADYQQVLKGLYDSTLEQAMVKLKIIEPPEEEPVLQELSPFTSDVLADVITRFFPGQDAELREAMRTEEKYASVSSVRLEGQETCCTVYCHPKHQHGIPGPVCVSLDPNVPRVPIKEMPNEIRPVELVVKSLAQSFNLPEAEVKDILESEEVTPTTA